MTELWDDFVFDLDMPTDKPEDKPSPQKIRVGTQRGKQRFNMRRYASEQALLAAAPWHYRMGDTYHCISFGDVDFLTYVRHALRQQRADYLLLSSWCYGVEDVREIAEWVRRGLIGRLDCYMGEIAGASYANCQAELERAARKTGGRCGIFQNHSKVGVMLGPRFDCAITSSANINTNPRCENTVITCDHDVALFYKGFFDAISPFNGNPDGWKPYQEEARHERTEMGAE